MEFPIFTVCSDSHRLNEQGKVFPDNIDDDVWTVFHGTSGFYGESIERQGFGATPPVSFAQLQQVAAVFDKMRWEGGSAYACLSSYSIKHDHDSGELPSGRCFFDPASHKAMRFSLKNYAGGEKLMLLRACFEKLDSYLGDPKVREQHVVNWKDNPYFAASDGSKRIPQLCEQPNVDLGWLAGELAKLAPIREKAFRPLIQYDHGIVYAVRMTPEDVPTLRSCNSAGIDSTKPIPPSKIIAKAIVPTGDRWRWLSDIPNDIEAYERRLSSGLFEALGVLKKLPST